MRGEHRLAHEFVEYIPDVLAEGTLYVSMRYATVVHKCCCGCGTDVVTPLSPTDWRLIFDGKTISLEPSIGNWSFACRSHYWIVGSTVRWARGMSDEEIAAGRAFDQRAKDAYYKRTPPMAAGATTESTATEATVGLWGRLKSWWTARRS